MQEKLAAAHTRRAVLSTGGLLIGATVLPQVVSAAMPPIRTVVPPVAPPLKVPAAPVTSPRVVRPELLRRALAALDRNPQAKRDRIAIADFAAPSSQRRFHLLDLAGGTSRSMLVSHGSGSDPAHSGYLQRFSNAFNSNASCEGAFLASDYYVGKHGRSQRLIGLDATNNNALGRAIVVHGAWYASPDVLRARGVLGRSQGCFAVGEQDLAELFDRLGPGRMIYAAKV